MARRKPDWNVYTLKELQKSESEKQNLERRIQIFESQNQIFESQNQIFEYTIFESVQLTINGDRQMIIPNSKSPYIQIAHLINTCYMHHEKRQQIITYLVNTHNVLCNNNAQNHCHDIIKAWLDVFIDMLSDNNHPFSPDGIKDELVIDCHQELILFGYEQPGSGWTFENNTIINYSADDRLYNFSEQFRELKEQCYMFSRRVWLPIAGKLLNHYKMDCDNLMSYCSSIKPNCWCISPKTVFNGLAELVIKHKDMILAEVERKKLEDLLVKFENRNTSTNKDSSATQFTPSSKAIKRRL